MKKTIFLNLILMYTFEISSQVSSMGTTSPVAPPNPILGWDGTGVGGSKPLDLKNGFINQPIRFFTNGTATNGLAGTTERMRIAPNGYIGINNNNPNYPLHIIGFNQANLMEWNKGLTLSNRAALYFDGGSHPTLFMAHPSLSPEGNFFCGSVPTLQNAVPADYVFTIYTTTTNYSNPINTVNFFKNVLVSHGEAINVTSLNERRLGINTLNPQNVVEINTTSNSAIPGNSGLRFSDLTRFSTITPNPGTGVLSVDNNGNVIYVQNGIVGPQGEQGIPGTPGTPGTAGEDAFVACNDSNPSAGQLPSDSKINLNDKNFYFKSDNYTLNKNQFLNRFNFFIS